jgi:hypothetical protein
LQYFFKCGRKKTLKFFMAPGGGRGEREREREKDTLHRTHVLPLLNIWILIDFKLFIYL